MPDEAVQLPKRQPPLPAAPGVAEVGDGDATADEVGGVVGGGGVEAEHGGDAEVLEELGVEARRELAPAVDVDPLLARREVLARGVEEEQATREDVVDLAVDDAVGIK